MIKIEEIRNKDHVIFGKKHEGSILKGHKAEIEPKKFIRIYGQEWNHRDAPVNFDKTFKIGDWAEYDSYNLIYAA